MFLNNPLGELSLLLINQSYYELHWYFRLSHKSRQKDKIEN